MNRTGSLEKLEFEEFISKLGIFLARQELTTIYNSFGSPGDGLVAYQEFIGILRVRTSLNKAI